MNDNLTLEDLGTMSGLTLRTLRYYIQEGILQGPDTHGKFSRYSQQHLDRLELIQRLKNLRLPLQEIRHLLDNMTPEELSQVRQYQDVLKYTLENPIIDHSAPESRKEGASALEYIQNLERGRESVRSISKPMPAPRPLPQAPSPALFQDTDTLKNQTTPGTQETWSRTILHEGIELNIRHPNNADAQKKIEQLIDFAQNLFGDQSTREK